MEKIAKYANKTVTNESTGYATKILQHATNLSSKLIEVEICKASLTPELTEECQQIDSVDEELVMDEMWNDKSLSYRYQNFF